ncbi:MAG: ATP-binding protein [Bacteroidales bacterium]
MDQKVIHISNDIQNLDYLHEQVDLLGEGWEFPMKLTMQIKLVLEELVSNIIFYGFPDKGEHIIEIKLEFTGETIRIVLTDDGIPFDPLQAASPDLSVAVDERKIGGLGIHFVQQIMDEISYERMSDKNILSLSKGVSRQ